MKICIYAIAKNEAPKASGVYSITHVESGRVYVGKSRNIARRWREHLRDAERGVQTAIYNALRKHGAEAFEWKVLDLCEIDALDAVEIRWIKELRALECGFNCTPGGDGLRTGSRHTEAANRAKSDRQRGKSKSPAAILAAAAPRKGKPLPAAVLEAAANFNRGRHRDFSAEHRQRISLAKQGKKMPEGAVAKAWITRKANAQRSREAQA